MAVKKSKLYAKLWAEKQWITICCRPHSAIARELNDRIKQYGTLEKNLKKVKKDILFCKKYYRTTPQEYFLYHFEQLNHTGRKEYVGRYQLTKFWNQFNRNEAHLIFADKEKNYQRFQPYYGREVVKIASESDREKFDAFTAKYKRFVMKPIADHQGNGVRIVEADQNLDEVFQSYIALPGGAVLEELIEQAEEMAKFHPHSVNTIRLVTFYDRDKLTKICAVLRMGRNGNVIDNACAGGIYAVIDMETGIIDSPATSQKQEKYFSHPDTGVKILGQSIPRWKELMQLVEELVRVVPEQKQVGWDFALTNQGWIVVEGNDRPGIQRLVPNRGLRTVMQCMYDAYHE